MWFSPAERDPRLARLASSPLLGGPLRGRGPGRRDRGDAAPSRRVPAPSRTLLERKAERRPARPGHRQFIARGLRLPAAVSHHNNMQSAARGRPPRRAHCTRLQVPGPGAQSKRGHRDPRGRASRASQVLLAGGLLQHCEMPATGAPQPRPLPTLLSPGREGKSSSCPRDSAKGSVPEQCSAGHGEAPAPDAASLGPSSLLHFLRRRSPCG